MTRVLAWGMLLAALAWAPSAHAAFSAPTNGKIAFSNSDGGVWTMNPDGTNQSRLRDGYEPNWSADGSKLVFAYQHDIRIMPADGSSEMVVLSAPGTTPEGGFRAWHAPSWSPDGTQVVAGLTDTFEFTYETLSTAWADGSGIAQQDITYGASPVWDPTGTEIAYVSRPGADTPAQGIYAIHPDGSNQHIVWEQMREFAPWPTSDPDYAPDGSQIVFSTPYPGQGSQIYVVAAAGGTPVRLTNNASNDVDPVFSPNGQKIAFASDRDGNFEIYTMNADGTGQTRLTNDPGPQVEPSWQPIPGPSYIRPKGATPQRVPMVLAFRQCSLPTRTHGPPISVPSCAPPVPESGQLTVGSPDANGAAANMVAHVRYATVLGNPGTPADEADIEIRANINDVRVKATNLDYAGEVEPQAVMRITDRNNTNGDPATTQDFVLPMTVQCAPTADPSVGSTCSLFSSVDAILPGTILERARTVFQIGETRVMDGGADGDTATTPNTIFLRQGFYAP